MLIEINENNIDDRKIKKVVECINNDGIIIIPTDTVYALACSIYSLPAIEKVSRFKGVKPEKANLSFLCNDLKNIAEYTKPFDRSVYKLLNRSLPGPFTFILEASTKVPGIFRARKKNICIRIPDQKVTLSIIQQLGHPLMSASLHDVNDPITDYLTDPDEIYERFSDMVDMIVDCGAGGNVPSTIVDCTTDDITVVRAGKGVLS